MKLRKQNKRTPSPLAYCQRSYRRLVEMEGLVSFEVKVRETDLQILAPADHSELATGLVHQYRNQLENYISRNPNFLSSLIPLPMDSLAPPLIKEMYRAADAALVGPMAAVAGVVSQFVGQGLMKELGVEEIMVENGGDIFLSRSSDCTVAIFAGSSSLSNKVGIKIKSGQMPLGICTSSATVGHSLSLGQADAVTVLSKSCALADAVATRLGNETGQDTALDEILSIAANIDGILGTVIIRGEQLGGWGDLELTGI